MKAAKLREPCQLSAAKFGLLSQMHNMKLSVLRDQN